MTENEIYAKFKDYGNLELAIKVGQHIYLNYSPDIDPDSIIYKCNINGIRLYRVPESAIALHNNTFIKSRILYFIKKFDILVTNVHTNMAWSEMLNIFKDCGEIAHFRYIRKNCEGEICDKSFVVTFKTEEAVEKAVQTVNNTIHMGNRIFVAKDVARRLVDYKRTVLLNELKPKVSLNTIYEFFIRYGPIELITKQAATHVAYVTYVSEESANDATTCVTVPETIANNGSISVEKSTGLSCK